MRDYSKVSPQFWTRGSGKRLRGHADAQVIALYLVTCPSANMIGVYYVPFVSIAHETGLGEERTRAALARVAEVDFAHYDEEAELAWVPNMAAYQIGDELKPGDKRRGGPIRAEVDKVGRHPFVAEFWHRYGEAYGLGEPPDGLGWDEREAPPMPLRSPSEAPPMGHTLQSGRAGTGAGEEQEQKIPPTPRGRTSTSAFQARPGLGGFEEESYLQGIADGIGSRPAPLSPIDRTHVTRGIAKCPLPAGASSEEILAWVRSSAARWAKLHVEAGKAEFQRGWHPAKWVEWLNLGSPLPAPASKPRAEPPPPPYHREFDPVAFKAEQAALRDAAWAEEARLAEKRKAKDALRQAGRSQGGDPNPETRPDPRSGPANGNHESGPTKAIGTAGAPVVPIAGRRASP